MSRFHRQIGDYIHFVLMSFSKEEYVLSVTVMFLFVQKQIFDLQFSQLLSNITLQT